MYSPPPTESVGDKWYRRGLDAALIVLIVGMIVLLAWTVVRLDRRGERLDHLVATRQAGCVCPTPVP